MKTTNKQIRILRQLTVFSWWGWLWMTPISVVVRDELLTRLELWEISQQTQVPQISHFRGSDPSPSWLVMVFPHFWTFAAVFRLTTVASNELDGHQKSRSLKMQHSMLFLRYQEVIKWLIIVFSRSRTLARCFLLTKDSSGTLVCWCAFIPRLEC